jgi:hypothetical protein
MVRVVIDGNIGAGKTTQLDLLEAKGFFVKREPIEKWPLEEFYSDPSRWAFLLHMRILCTHRPIKTNKLAIYERSLQSSYWVFWQVLKKKGLVTSTEDATYSQLYDEMAWYPSLYIFLRKDPEIAYKHVQQRGQAGDSKVTLEYMKELDEEYLNLLRTLPCKVRVVNANQSVENIHKDICMHLAENELLSPFTKREEVQKPSRGGGPLSCPPFQHMCNLS